jgi:signal transduction histidine kinase
VALADPNASLDSLRSAHERVLASEQQLEDLIEALLSLASGERGLDVREPVELAALTGDLLAARAGEIERHRLQLRATLEHAPTEGSRQLLERLAANLLDNAIHHNTAGGRIEVSTATTAEAAVLSVTNDGPVIPARELERLRAPFQRLHGARVSRGDGHGLGLSIVHAIATAHAAAITVRAKPDGGLDVEVRFALPARGRQPPAGY